MTLKLLYFAALADLAQRTGEDYTLTGDTSVRGLLTALRARGELWERLLSGAIKITINTQFAEPDTALRDGDEVAFVPVPTQSP